ncbi:MULTISPECIES: heparan-alpha-glucosaminide N-acetyltransferase domain-containing protein [unclassified Pseudonocardia]|uniref:heparan-alpha-glucosaminide N-acetyltransferase domain-containing protein n=1 Tax=unclassified Pseudonocardia TaxID=2619320 RepID=UPI0007613791|nr:MULTISPECIES: heparan-alpha-glucosaminide N-acetyltransferase domain-containing protein [unclassified Pseudonocardia]
MPSPAAVTARTAGPEVTAPLPVPDARRRPRLAGVDVARGAAVLGMIATHALPQATDAGDPTTAAVVAAGRSAATFVFVAGVSVAFLSGRRDGVHGRARLAASAGLLVRAGVVLALGLVVGTLSPLNGIWGILPVYGLLFVLVLPLLGLGPRALAAVTAAIVALGPVLLMTTSAAELPLAGEDDPTLVTLLLDPLGLLVQLLLSGAYPVVVYLAYLTAGLAVGRLDLSSGRVAGWLLGGGLALAVTARAVSWYLLDVLGGLDALVRGSGADDPARAATTLLWEENQPLTSWWHLALPAPHSHTPVDLLHTLGSASAVLGASLLLSRVPIVRRMLSPLAAAGSMALTVYCAHLVLLATGIWSDDPTLLFTAMAVGALLGALLWRHLLGQGPLEKLVSVPATAARRAVAAGPARTPSTGLSVGARAATRVAAGTAAVVVLVTALGLGVWTRSTAPVPAAGPEVTGSAPADPDAADAAGPDAARYCALSVRYSALLDTEEDPAPEALRDAADTATEMARVAPAPVAGPVALLADDARAEAGVTGATAPDPAAVETAQAAVDAFEETGCA